MASLTSNPPGFGSSPSDNPLGVVLAQAQPAQRRAALSLLLTGRAQPVSPAVETFLSFAKRQQLDLTRLFLAYAPQAPGTPLSSGLLIPSPGRAAMLFPAPANTPRTTRLLAETVKTILEHAKTESDRILLVQALLDPGQTGETEALLTAGMRSLATLNYLSRTTQGGDLDLSTGKTFHMPGVELDHLTFSPKTRPRFARAILASYEQTLDCPELLGLRPIEDVMEGHLNTGRHDPEHWHLLEQDGEPAAVMLWARTAEGTAFELVYFGVAPAFRRRGLAKRLLQFGLQGVARHGGSRAILAVDRRNRPALGLYLGLGFQEQQSKQAFILPLQ